jgi:hypothetical protein
MKVSNIFLLLLIILLSGCSSEEHIKFENIPVDGKIDEFASELTKRGYTESQLTEENKIKLRGMFLGKACKIYVYGTSKSKTAYKVLVNFPGEVKDSLEYSYPRIQMWYTTRYGIGKSKFKQHRIAERFLFNEPKRIRHLNPGDYTRYNTDSGDITLEVREGYLSITYSDKLNGKLEESEMKAVDQK